MDTGKFVLETHQEVMVPQLASAGACSNDRNTVYHPETFQGGRCRGLMMSAGETCQSAEGAHVKLPGFSS